VSEQPGNVGQSAVADETQANKSGLKSGGIYGEYIETVAEALDRDDFALAKFLAQPLHYGELGDLIEALGADQRTKLIEILRDTFDPVVLTELDESVREHVIEQLGITAIAESVAEMDSDDAVFVLGELEDHEQKQVLDALPADERTIIQEGLGYAEHTAGRLMQREVVAVPETWTVGEAIDFMRNAEDLPPDFYDVMLVDPRHHPTGAAPLSRIISARRDIALSQLVIKDMKTIPVTMDQEEVAFLFRQRDLISAPVVDVDGRLVGSITIDDIVDVIDEEHQEDIMNMAGVSEGDTLFAAVADTIRSRFKWLALYTVCAFGSASVISIFRGSITEMVALAVLMPIVAAMGGTASVQTLTVAVRAIAMKELTPANAMRNVGKEFMVAVLNGFVFAIIIGSIAWFWFDSPMLGFVIGLALVLNLIVAGVYGSTLPIILQRCGYDPAVASSAFATAITDIVGFFVFLGLGTLLLL
jgi:magnesium transporter